MCALLCWFGSDRVEKSQKSRRRRAQVLLFVSLCLLGVYNRENIVAVSCQVRYVPILPAWFFLLLLIHSLHNKTHGKSVWRGMVIRIIIVVAVWCSHQPLILSRSLVIHPFVCLLIKWTHIIYWLVCFNRENNCACFSYFRYLLLLDWIAFFLGKQALKNKPVW